MARSGEFSHMHQCMVLTHLRRNSVWEFVGPGIQQDLWIAVQRAPVG